MTDTPSLDIKSTTLYAIRVVLHTDDLSRLLPALEARMAEAAGFFDDEPVVIDASLLEQPTDWAQLVQALHEHKLPTIGVMAEDGPVLASAREAGLARVSLPSLVKRAQNRAEDIDQLVTLRDAAAPESAAAAEPDAAAEPVEAEAEPDAVEVVIEAASNLLQPEASHTAALVIQRPLRSGQKVYARNADLIVLGMVSNGAEILADGNIHVYGPLRGKAMAGARGDTESRIFTTQFQAELVAVAGIYRTMTQQLPDSIQNKPAQVRLSGEKLLIDALAI